MHIHIVHNVGPSIRQFMIKFAIDVVRKSSAQPILWIAGRLPCFSCCFPFL